MEVLRRVVDSLRDAARDAGVEIVTGDTKVVEKGRATNSLSIRRESGWCPKVSSSRPTGRGRGTKFC